jgi:hypothetical protein
VNAIYHLRGRLASVSASLLLVFSREILKWQFPAFAAAEKLGIALTALRRAFFPLPHGFEQN